MSLGGGFSTKLFIQGGFINGNKVNVYYEQLCQMLPTPIGGWLSQSVFLSLFYMESQSEGMFENLHFQINHTKNVIVRQNQGPLVNTYLVY